MWSYANNRLGAFIDKSVTTAAIPGSIVQLNSNGQINTDLIPTQRNFTSFISAGYGSRLNQVNNIPASDMQAGDIATENFYQFELTLSSSLGTAFNDGALLLQLQLVYIQLLLLKLLKVLTISYEMLQLVNI